MAVNTPSAEVLSHLLGGFARVTRRVEVLGANGVTLWDDIGLLDGTINVDASRDERRTLDITLTDNRGRLEAGINGLWYDKLIRPWRGVKWTGGSWEAPLGVFMIDTISDVTRIKRRYEDRANDGAPPALDPETPFTHVVQVSGRDLTKRLLKAEFANVTTFVAGTSIDTIIHALAVNGGVTVVSLPWTGTNPAPVLEIDQTFEADSSYWAAILLLCQSYGYEVYIDIAATLVVRAYRDPSTQGAVWNFQTGKTEGNLASYKKILNDTELYNHVRVRGSGQSNAFVFAEVEITDTTSPIHKSQIGDRPYPYPSATVMNNEEARQLAAILLSIHSLESYEVDLGSIVLPWMEAGEVVHFLDAMAPATSDPTQFLLTNFSIPLGLGQTMDGVAKRLLPVAA